VTLTLESVLLVMALEVEAREVLGKVSSELLLTGVGKINAAHRLTRRLAERRAAGQAPHLVLNFGTAGSRTLPTGSVVVCHRFVQNDMDARGLGFELGHTPFDELAPMLEFPPLFGQLPISHLQGGVCASADRFDTGHEGLPCDAIDMEAYALARVCALEGVRFGCVKYITDGADHAAATDWVASLPHAAAAFVRVYQALPSVPDPGA
jgi:adenosylhomocysteine nucleosidase